MTEIELSSVLRRLVETKRDESQAQIAEAIGVSASALSKYLNGGEHPRLVTVVALAEYFDVTLDYLVLGDATPPPTYEDQFIERLDRHLEDRAMLERSRHDLALRLADQLVERIGDQLIDWAENVASEVDTRRAWPGVLDEADVAAVEGKSVRADLLVPYLDEDMGDSGRMSKMVAKTGANINRDVQYRVLVDVREGKEWEVIIPEYRRLLRVNLNCPEDRIEANFKVKKLPRKVYAGFANYWLPESDYPTYELADRGVQDRQGNHLFSIVQPGHERSRAHLILRPEHARAADEFFESGWDDPAAEAL
jgi:transcriptional regulator with XRE-family HTH domain